MNGDVVRLIDAARQVAANAYAPYSGFGVGAAVLIEDGSIIAGCNFENASYGLSLCAETVALASVNTQGKLNQVRAVAVIGGKLVNGSISGNTVVYPCGRCRQVIFEAGQQSGCDIPVHSAAADGKTILTHKISVLLPHTFGPAALL
jgi:cytidine deaminase